MMERYKGPVANYSTGLQGTDHLAADMKVRVAGMEVQPGEVYTAEAHFDILLGIRDVEHRFAVDIGRTVEVGMLGCHTVGQERVRHRLGEKAGYSHKGLLMVHTDDFEEADKALAEVARMPGLVVQGQDTAGTEVPVELQLDMLGQREHRSDLNSEQLEPHCCCSATELLEVHCHQLLQRRLAGLSKRHVTQHYSVLVSLIRARQLIPQNERYM